VEVQVFLPALRKARIYELFFLAIGHAFSLATCAAGGVASLTIFLSKIASF